MPASRFLKKRRHVTYQDVGSSLSPSTLEENRLTTNLESRNVISAEKTLYESSLNQWKSKDEDFAKSIKKRLSDLANSLSPSSSSSTFAASSSSPSGFRSVTATGLQQQQQQQQHRSIGDSFVWPSRETIARGTCVPSVLHLERPAVSLDRWRGTSHGAAGTDTAVRSFLLDRKFSKAPRPEDDDESRLVRSMWEIVRSLGDARGPHDRPAENYYWHPKPGTRRAELAEFSRNIGPLLPSADTVHYYRLDGRNFWSRLAACKEEFLRTEYLVNSMFDCGQGFGDYHFVYPCRRETAWTSPPAASLLSSNIRTFSPADEAIRWAQQHRLKMIDY